MNKLLLNELEKAPLNAGFSAAFGGAPERYLQGRGGYRVHGGGFAGTVQAFVPFDLLKSFREGIDAVLGEGACHVLSIRPEGGVEAQ